MNSEWVTSTGHYLWATLLVGFTCPILKEIWQKRRLKLEINRGFQQAQIGSTFLVYGKYGPSYNSTDSRRRQFWVCQEVMSSHCHFLPRGSRPSKLSKPYSFVVWYSIRRFCQNFVFLNYVQSQLMRAAAIVKNSNSWRENLFLRCHSETSLFYSKSSVLFYFFFELHTEKYKNACIFLYKLSRNCEPFSSFKKVAINSFSKTCSTSLW